jgi:hypothetical protein
MILTTLGTSRILRVLEETDSSLNIVWILSFPALIALFSRSILCLTIDFLKKISRNSRNSSLSNHVLTSFSIKISNSFDKELSFVVYSVIAASFPLINI